MKEGDLALVHMPFAFKPCFFREVQKMGYKRVLYLDSSILPNVSLNNFFTIIANKGYFVTRNSYYLDFEFLCIRPKIAHYFGYSFSEVSYLLSCSACVCGVDFTNPVAAQIIDDWHAAAQDSHAFYSPRSDQAALSLVLHRLHLTDWLPCPTSTLFYVDRHYVKDR